MAVHGKFDRPRSNCGTTEQRIRREDDETNYCPKCQMGDEILRDRVLSELLRSDWPRTIDELEEMKEDAAILAESLLRSNKRDK